MIKKSDFEKLDSQSKIDWITHFLSEFDSNQILEIRDFWEMRKNYLSESIVMNIYDILLSQHKDYIDSSVNIISKYVHDVKEREQEEVDGANPDDILNSI